MKAYKIDDLTIDMRIYPREKIDEQHVHQLSQVLLLDPSLYPREDIDRDHALQLAEAIKVGRVLPPVVICRRTLKVIDGAHRIYAYRMLGREEIDCIEEDYRDERDMFLDAMRLNAAHGRPLSASDKGLCALRAEKLHIDMSDVARELHIEVAYCGELRTAVKAQQITADRATAKRVFGWSRGERKSDRPSPRFNGTPHAEAPPEVAVVESDDPVDSQPVFFSDDKAALARKCAKTLADLFEKEEVSRDDEMLKELCEMLNWHIEEVFGFSAK